MKRKTKERANLIQLTFSALNKTGLVFACFLFGGLVFAGVSFWRTIQEDKPESHNNVVDESHNNVVDDVESLLFLASLSEQKTMSESSYIIYRDITYKTAKDFFMFRMIFEKYASDYGIVQYEGFDRDFGEKLFALPLEGLDYVLKGDLQKIKMQKIMRRKEARARRSQELQSKARNDSGIEKMREKDPSDFLATATSSDKIRKELELKEYQKDYNDLYKKDYYFRYGIGPPE